MGKRPNIWVFGVAHSGTTIVTSCLEALGWNTGDVDVFHQENKHVFRLDAGNISGRLSADNFVAEAAKFLRHSNKIIQPWIFKHPQSIKNQQLWNIAFGQVFKQPQDYPFMLFMTKSRDALVRSYQKRIRVNPRHRGYVSTHELLNAQILAEQHFEQYPGPKLHVPFEKLTDAMKLFSVARADSPTLDPVLYPE